MQNNSLDFSEMVGGSFDFHPLQQEISVKLFDPKHPLVSSFEGQGFTHYDVLHEKIFTLLLNQKLLTLFQRLLHPFLWALQ